LVLPKSESKKGGLAVKNQLQSDAFKHDLIDAIKANIEKTVRQWVGDMAAGHILEMQSNFFGETQGALDNVQINISLGIFGDAELLQEAKEIDDDLFSEPPMTWERVVDEIPGINN